MTEYRGIFEMYYLSNPGCLYSPLRTMYNLILVVCIFTVRESHNLVLIHLYPAMHLMVGLGVKEEGEKSSNRRYYLVEDPVRVMTTREVNIFGNSIK